MAYRDEMTMPVPWPEAFEMRNTTYRRVPPGAIGWTERPGWACAVYENPHRDWVGFMVSPEELVGNPTHQARQDLVAAKIDLARKLKS